MPSRAALVLLVERVLAVAGGQPVLLSEVRLAQQVRGEDAGPALEALIDEHLMFAEASRLPQAALTEEEEARALLALQARLPAPVRDPEAVRRMARRQATIVKYIEFRFRPQVRIPAEDAARDAAGEGEAKDALEAEDLDRRIEAWVKDLRAAAEVRYNAP
jgi:hypothetical protein